MKLLIARDANVNAKETARGQTPLMLAVAENHEEVVRILIASHADRTTTPCVGWRGSLAPVTDWT